MINRKTKIVLEGIIGDQESLSYLLTHYKPIVDKLRAGHAELDLKKHCDYPIFGIRADECNRGNRLLFIMLQKNGASYLYFLGDVENHDYRKSPFFQPGRLSSFLERNKLENSQELDIDYTHLSEDNFFEDDSQFEERGTNSAIKPMAFYNQDFIELTPYNDHFIQLNDEQKEAIKIGVPSLITGGPGAGKSFIASKFLVELSDKAENSVVFITHFLPLMLFMRKQFMQQLGGLETKGKVCFTTYDELAKEFALEKKLTLVGEKELMDWLKLYINGKNNKFIRKFISDLETIYQEFRIISGHYDTENNSEPDSTPYLKLGERGSLFFESEQKQWLWEAYHAYQEHLKKYQQINPEFCTLDLSNKYSYVILDEVQDYTPPEFRSIFKLAKGQIVCLGDSHQNLIDPKSSLNLKFIRSYFNKWGINIPHHKLKITHRVPKKIAELVNDLCQLNYALEEGNPNNDEGSFIKSSRLDHAGEIKCITPSYHDLAKEAQGETAVITRGENIKKAKERYQTDLIFDINNIKGLEFPNIIIDIFDDPQYGEIDKILLTLDLDRYAYQENKKISRPKSVTKNQKYGTKLKRLFVAASRATDKLILVMNEKELPHLFKFLNKRSSPYIVEEKRSVNHPPAPINWYERSEKLLINGHEPQAQAIFLDKNKLNMTMEQFNAFKENVLGLSLQDSPKDKTLPKQPILSDEQETKKSKEIIPEKSIKKNNEEKIKERKIYLNRLLKFFNDASLKNLFEDRRFEELMFKFIFGKNNGSKKPEENEVLFTTIIKNENLSKIFCAFLNKNPKYKKKFTIQIMCSPFQITRDLINYSIFYASPLFFLAVNEKNGGTILKTLLIENNELALNMTGEILCQRVSDSQASFSWENFSILQILLLNEKNIEILAFLFTLNPKLKLQISSESLCSALYFDGATDNISAFYYLTRNEESCQILDDLLITNTNLKISAETLYRSLTSKAGNFRHCTSFFGLSKSASGRKILSRLIQDPEIMKGITEQALFLGHLDILDSALYWLATDDVGLDILKSLLEANPNLINSPYVAEALCRKINCKGDPTNHDCSALFMLAKTAKGREILRLFVEKKEVCQHITEKALFSKRKNINDTAFYWLTTDEIGVASLKLLLESNPKLAESPRLAEALNLAVNNEKDRINHRQIPLGWLISSNVGLEFLLYVARCNETVAAKLADPRIGEYIGNSLTFRQDAKAYSMLLLLIGRAKKGMPLFKGLLEVVPHLKIKAKALCDPYSSDVHDDCSILASFSVHSGTGHSLFFSLLNKCPEIALGITMEALCRTYSLKDEQDRREFAKLTPEERRTFSRYCQLPLLKFTLTPDGRQVLNFLFEKNIDLLKQTIDILSSMVNDPLKASLKILKKPGVCDDIKEILSASNEKQPSLVVALFEKYPQITFNIAAEYWHQNVDDYNFESYDFKETKNSENEQKEGKFTVSQNTSTLFCNNFTNHEEKKKLNELELNTAQNLSSTELPNEDVKEGPLI